MGRFFKRTASRAVVQPEPSHPSWFERAGRGGMTGKLGAGDLEFGAKRDGVAPTLEKVGLSDLLYGGSRVTADLKANHVEPSVLSGPLAEAMRQIEDKFHQGVYDAAAVPLIEDYLKQMRQIAILQARRAELLGSRVSDVKEANARAFAAVAEQREARERRIDQEHAAACAGSAAKREARIAKAHARRDAAMRRAEQRATESVVRAENKRERLQEERARRLMRMSYKEAQEKRENARRELAEERKLADEFRKAEMEQAQVELQQKVREEDLAQARAAAELRAEQERLKIAEKAAELDAEAAVHAERLAQAKEELARIEQEALRIACERAEAQAAASAAAAALSAEEPERQKNEAPAPASTWKQSLLSFLTGKGRLPKANEEVAASAEEAPDELGDEDAQLTEDDGSLEGSCEESETACVEEAEDLPDEEQEREDD